MNDVDDVGNGNVGVQFGDHHASSVLLENVRNTHHHNVVVVNQRGGDRRPHGGFHKPTLTSLRV